MAICFAYISFFFFSDFFFFFMWTILKFFTEILTVLLLFYALVSRSGSQLPDQGSNPHSLHWKVKS